MNDGPAMRSGREQSAAGTAITTSSCLAKKRQQEPKSPHGAVATAHVSRAFIVVAFPAPLVLAVLRIRTLGLGFILAISECRAVEYVHVHSCTGVNGGCCQGRYA